MDSLYDSLLSLNTVKGAYEAWADYRGALTAFVQAHTEEGGSCLIVGAGESNDLDLGRLSERFDSVILLDTDTAAMERAQSRYPSPKIKLHTADLLGVSAEAYRELDREMLLGLRAKLSGEELTDIFLGMTEHALKNALPDPLPEADTVLCCGVHSQLLSMFARMAGVYARYAGIGLERIFGQISRYNAAFQPAFNTRLMSAARQTLILGLETARLGTPGGIEGAAQALSDLSARAPDTVKTELFWPFDVTQGKVYRICITAIQTRETKENGPV